MPWLGWRVQLHSLELDLREVLGVQSCPAVDSVQPSDLMLYTLHSNSIDSARVWARLFLLYCFRSVTCCQRASAPH